MVVHFLLLHQNLECCKIPFGLVAAEDDPNGWVRLLLSDDFHRYHNYILLPT